MATAGQFEIEVNDEVTLSRDSMIEHAEHGPMRVDGITVGPHRKTAEFKSELGPVGLELSDEEIREQWGETMASDPFELREPGSLKTTNEGITVEGSDVEVDLVIEGPEEDVERVQMHAVDQIVRGLQGVRDEEHPSDCDGASYTIDWDKIFEGEE